MHCTVYIEKLIGLIEVSKYCIQTSPIIVKIMYLIVGLYCIEVINLKEEEAIENLFLKKVF
jgi:hypothetical protein